MEWEYALFMLHPVAHDGDIMTRVGGKHRFDMEERKAAFPI